MFERQVKMTVKYFEDLQQAETFETPSRKVTEKDIKRFAELSGDFNPLHLNEEYSRRSIFGRRVAHGLLTLSMADGFWMKSGVFDGTIVAFYGIEHLRFTKPVYIGDTLSAKITVKEKNEKGKFGLLTLENNVMNQSGDTVLVFDALLLLKKRATQAER